MPESKVDELDLSASDFIEISYRHHRIATLWANQGDLRPLAKQMDGSTWKRRLVRSLIPTVARAILVLRKAGLQVCLPRDSLGAKPNENSIDLLNPILKVAADQKISIKSAVIFWPTGDRSSRRYVVGLDSERTPRLFCKISMNPQTDERLFRAEDQVLKRLQNMPLRDWLTPRSYGVEITDNYIALTLSALPGARSNLSTDRHPHPFPLKPMRGDSFTQRKIAGDLSWFPHNVSELVCSESFRAKVERIRSEEIAIGLAHGDVTKSNTMMTSHEQNWLLDWEFAAEDAPLKLDLVAAVLYRITTLRRRPQLPIVVQQRLLADCSVHGADERDVILALIYLSNHQNRWAKELTQSDWTSSRFVAEPSDLGGEDHMPYRTTFSTASSAQRYDAGTYARESWSSLLWHSERRFLAELLGRRDFVPTRSHYLDFACGTGRVAEFLSPGFLSATGVDISEAMLVRARERVPGVCFERADISNGDYSLSEPADLITAFRFLLNAEPRDRMPALQWMRAQLRDSNSRIIVNNHGNLTSHKAALYLIHRYFRRGHVSTGNVLSHREMIDFVRSAGLSIQEVRGFGHLGGHAHRFLGYRRMAWVQDRLGTIRCLERFAEDQIYVLAPKS